MTGYPYRCTIGARSSLMVMSKRLESHLQTVAWCREWMAQNAVESANLIPYSATLTHAGTTIELGRKIARVRESLRLGRSLHPDAIAAYESLPHWSWTAPDYPHRAGPARTTAERLPARAREWMRLHKVDSADQIGRFDTLEVDGRPYTLGNQLARMRQLYAAGELTPEQIEALEQLPGWRWTPRRQRPRGQRRLAAGASRSSEPSRAQPVP